MEKNPRKKASEEETRPGACDLAAPVPFGEQTALAFFSVQVPLLGLGSTDGGQHREHRGQHRLLLLQDDGRVPRLAELTAHQVKKEIPRGFSSIRTLHLRNISQVVI